MAMSREDRKALIMEDFNWLDDIKVHNLNGKLLLGDAELPYNIGHIFYEKEFTEKYLMGFALGNAQGINYFPVETWCSFTNNGTRAVLVVDEEHTPVLLIPPLLAHKLTARDFQIMRAVSWHMHHNSADTQFGKDPNLNLSLSKKISERLDETKRTTYPEMILPEFYEKKGIIPEVEQKIYFIKDQVRGKKDPVAVDDLTKLRPIMYKHHRGEPVTKEERKFVTDMLRDKFDIEGLTNAPAAAKEAQQENKAPDNPLEC